MASRDPEQWIKWLDEVEASEMEVVASDESEDEEDRVEISDHDTESEQEAGVEDDELMEGILDNTTEVPYFTGKDKYTKWNKMPPPNSRTRKHNLVLKLPGPTGEAKNAKSVLDCFFIFIDEGLIDLIAQYTNIYIAKIKTNFIRHRDAKCTDACEMKAFLGILYLAGVKKSGRENILDLWNTDGTGCDLLYLTMSYNRFRFLCRCIRFDNIHDRDIRRNVDKLAAIREIFDMVVHKCKSAFIPSSYLSIDEQLVAFRGRCGFRQYLPSKPAKYGLKVFAMVDPKTMNTINMEIYAGVQPDGPYKISNTPSDVVKRLVEPIRNTNRNITMDRWFVSIPLALELLKEKKLTLIGTIKSNKRELPPEFVNTRSRREGSSMFGYQQDITVVSFVPKKYKNVLAVSTMHHDDEIDKSTNKPGIIMAYNQTKFGVDIVDKMCVMYNVGRSTRRWPLTIFFHLLNVAGINALNLYVANKDYEKTVRREFLFRLSRDLITPQIRKRIFAKNIPRGIRTKACLVLNIDEASLMETGGEPEST